MLNATKSYVGPVLFLEDDYYVSPDFYHMLRLLYDRKMRQVLVHVCVAQGSKLTGVLLPGACKICLGQLKSLG